MNVKIYSVVALTVFVTILSTINAKSIGFTSEELSHHQRIEKPLHHHQKIETPLKKAKPTKNIKTEVVKTDTQAS